MMKYQVLRETMPNSGLYQDLDVPLDGIDAATAVTMALDMMSDTGSRFALLPIETVRRERSDIPSPLPNVGNRPDDSDPGTQLGMQPGATPIVGTMPAVYLPPAGEEAAIQGVTEADKPEGAAPSTATDTPPAQAASTAAPAGS